MCSRSLYSQEKGKASLRCRLQGSVALGQRLRRDATRVIYEILSLSTVGVSKTHLIFRVNLSFELAERYILFLVRKGLLENGTDTEGTRKYWLTFRGARLLQLLNEVERELVDLYVKRPSSVLEVQDLPSRISLRSEGERARAPTRTQQAALS